MKQHSIALALTAFLCNLTPTQTRAGEHRVEAITSADGIAGWESRYRGAFHTLVSGAQDPVTVEQLQQLIAVVGQRATDKTRKSSDSWVSTFKRWIEGAKSGMIQERSEYSQVEKFVSSLDGYYQTNEHNGGYSPDKTRVEGELLSGLDQSWRHKGWWVTRQTYVGLDEVFTISENKVGDLLIPAYVMAAEEGRLLRKFIEKSGSAVNDAKTTIIYTGSPPAIPGVFYPAWIGVALVNMVLRKESEGKYTISLRDSDGGVLQEMVVAGEAMDFPADIRKRIYFPYSSIVYNQVHVRLVKRDATAKVPTFQDIANTPFPASIVVDQRHFNFEVPIDVALQGDAAIRALARIDSADTEKSTDGSASDRTAKALTISDVEREVIPEARHEDVDSATTWIWLGIGVVVIAVVGIGFGGRRRR